MDSKLEKTLNTLYKPDDLLETTATTYQMSNVTFGTINPFYVQGRVTVLQSALIPVPNETQSVCKDTQNSTINGRNIHHADLDDHTLHRLLGKSEQSP